MKLKKYILLAALISAITLPVLAAVPMPSAPPLTVDQKERVRCVAALAIVRAIQEDRTALPTLPAAPAELSFAIAQFVDLATNDTQRLLSSDSALDRLRQLEEALARMVESLEQRAYVHARARSNGHGAVE